MSLKEFQQINKFSNEQTNLNTAEQEEIQMITDNSKNSTTLLPINDITNAILDGNLDEFQKLVQEKDIQLHTIKDPREYTLLHRSCINNQENLAKVLIKEAENQLKEIYKNKNKVKNMMNLWINAQTDEGFTAMHFASFKGNIVQFKIFTQQFTKKLLQLLKDNGGVFNITNNQGVNILHIAAQGDQPISLVYLKDQGIDLNSADDKGSTALHWASFLGSENAVNFLTTWNINMNLKDKEGGMTPLHLAVTSGFLKSFSHFNLLGNCKVIHKLMVRGADKQVVEDKGLTPQALAKEQNFNNIVDLLSDETWMEKFTKTGIFKSKPVRSRTTLMLFILALLFLQSTDILFIFPCKAILLFITYQIQMISLLILTDIFFLISWQVNPGYLRKPQNITLLQVLKNHLSFKVCPKCEIPKPKRSRHCDYCDKCVKVFDHHCSYINNCVGARNHGYFLMFLISILLMCAFQLYLIIYAFTKDQINENYIFTGLSDKWLDEEQHHKLKTASCAIQIIPIGCYMFPLMQFLFSFNKIKQRYLFYVQLCNFTNGLTTHERFGYQALLKQKQRRKLKKKAIEESLLHDASNNNQSLEQTIDSSSLLRTRLDETTNSTFQVRKQLSQGCLQNFYMMCCENMHDQKFDVYDTSINTTRISTGNIQIG